MYKAGRSSPTLSKTFSDRNIVGLVVDLRFKVLSLRRERFFFRRTALSRSFQGEDAVFKENEEVDSLLPGRKFWPRAGRARRKSEQRRGVGRGKTLLVNHIFSHFWHLGKACAPPWLNKLRQFVRRVRRRALAIDGADSLLSFDHILQEKTSSSGRKFRLLSIPSSLEEHALHSLFAKYIRQILDAQFLPASLAFRVRRSDRTVPSHHEAARDISLYAVKWPGRSFWVSEVDIRGFYDSMDHGVIRTCFANLANDVDIDPRAISFIEAYLRSYNFESARRRAAAERDVAIEQIPWPETQLLELHPNGLHPDQIGIPQGGAISCVLANVVMHFADVEVYARLASEHRSHSMYRRYCDDTVLLSTTRDAAIRLIDTLTETLRRLKLPIHSPRRVRLPYRKHYSLFWESKSKIAYRWSSEAFPWLGFVGYQIRFDGVLRIRESSWLKEMSKQRKVANRIRKRGVRSAHRAQGVVKSRSSRE
jgi:hypothetical protein